MKKKRRKSRDSKKQRLGRNLREYSKGVAEMLPELLACMDLADEWQNRNTYHTSRLKAIK